jgi:hypothetical protein
VTVVTVDPLDRAKRAIDMLRSQGPLATIRFCDPELGEVRAAFYQPAGQVVPMESQPADPSAVMRNQVAAMLGIRLPGKPG